MLRDLRTKQLEFYENFFSTDYKIMYFYLTHLQMNCVMTSIVLSFCRGCANKIVDLEF